MEVSERLAAVPEESADCSTAAYPPRRHYRDSIRQVAVSGRQIRSTLLSHCQFGHSGSSYSSNSGASNSYPSNNSGCSSDSAVSTAPADFGADELKTIARRMVRDGYTQRMVQAFQYGSDPDGALENRFLELHIAPPAPALDGPDHVLESWFLELDVAWVLQIRQEHGSQWQLRLPDNLGLPLQELVKRWIRGLTVTVYSIVELLAIRHETMSVARLVKASILKMLVFIDAIVPAFKAESLRAVVDMYICVHRAMEIMGHPELVDLSLMPTLSVYVDMLKTAMSSTMEKVRTLVEFDDLWAIEIPRGGGEVHRNTRWIADCIMSLEEAQADSIFLSINNSSGSLSDMIRYTNDLLVRKSKLCSDPSLRYLFLQNNSYFVSQLAKPCEYGHYWKLEWETYMYSYLDVSWGHVLSYIFESHSPGPLHRWINTPSLVKFESAFTNTYQAQKFWKVPDPWLRDVLRRAITARVVLSYRYYLKEHPELAEHVSRRNSTPEVLEEMLGQLFEG